MGLDAHTGIHPEAAVLVGQHASAIISKTYGRSQRSHQATNWRSISGRPAANLGHCQRALKRPILVSNHCAPNMVTTQLQQLKADGVTYKAGTFPFLANDRTRALGDTTGMVKFLADAVTDEILGVHIVGPQARELIA